MRTDLICILWFFNLTNHVQCKYVFAQLVAFMNRSKFNRIVDKYNGNRYVKHFTWWNQLLAR